jgi:DNA replication protein
MNIKNLIKKNIIDFTELVLNNYYKIGLDETDAIIIIKLHYLLQRNITFIHPKKLSAMLSISATTTTKRINNLVDAGYIEMKLIKNKDGKETESFNLDHVIELILKSDFEEKNQDASSVQTDEARLVQLFESEFRRPLSVLDIQTITKWINEDGYSFESIKHALYDASKASKLTIRYIDAILLSSTKEEKKKYNQTTLIKDLKKIWTE